MTQYWIRVLCHYYPQIYLPWFFRLLIQSLKFALFKLSIHVQEHMVKGEKDHTFHIYVLGDLLMCVTFVFLHGVNLSSLVCILDFQCILCLHEVKFITVYLKTIPIFLNGRHSSASLYLEWWWYFVFAQSLLMCNTTKICISGLLLDLQDSSLKQEMKAKVQDARFASKKFLFFDWLLLLLS